jgi:dTDP-4-dehydrorhamnose reductase
VAEATALAVAKQFSPGWNSRRNGVYHLTCAGRTSWHGFAQAILGCAQQGLHEAAPIKTAEYPLPARRPANSVLANARIESAFGLRLPDWDKALAACLDEA